MAKTRTELPQLSEKIFITDGGMETDLIFNQQIDLPEFASYDLLRTQQGYETLFQYFIPYAKLAQKFQLGLVLETPTWRANSDWGEKIGDSADALELFNIQAVALVERIKLDYSTEQSPIISSGCIGPRGDGYSADIRMSVADAQKYHTRQIESFAKSNVDMVSALTMNYIDEAIGVTLAAQQVNLLVCISFTVETDGQLPTGESLADAMTAVDKATDTGPVYYMINCAHPNHFADILDDEICINRLQGIRANASSCSHAELDEAEDLDDGNPHELGQQLAEIRAQFPNINVLGGCCGTDLRHIEQIAICNQ